MKQRMSYDLTRRRYYELRQGGMTKDQAIFRMGQLILDYYGIEKITLEELDNPRRVTL